MKGRDGVLFDMVWTKANFVGNEVIVDVNGFDPKKSYVCEYVKKNTVDLPEWHFTCTCNSPFSCFPFWFCHRLHPHPLKATMRRCGP